MSFKQFFLVLFFVLMGHGRSDRWTLIVKALQDRSKQPKLLHINFHVVQTFNSLDWIRGLPFRGFSPRWGKLRISVLYTHMPSTCTCLGCQGTLGYGFGSGIFSSSCNWSQCMQDETIPKHAKHLWTSLNLREIAQPLKKRDPRFICSIL